MNESDSATALPSGSDLTLVILIPVFDDSSTSPATKEAQERRCDNESILLCLRRLAICQGATSICEY